MIGQRYYTPEDGWIRKDVINNADEFTVTGGIIYNPGFNGVDSAHPCRLGFSQLDFLLPDDAEQIRIIGVAVRGTNCQAKVFLNDQYLGSFSYYQDIGGGLASNYLNSFEQEIPPIKNAVISIRVTYDENYWNVQFHAVDFLIGENKERYLLKDNNTYQTIADDALAAIETDSPTAEIFNQSGFTDLEQVKSVYDSISTLFEILRYDPTAANTAIKIDHLPSPQLIIPKEDIPISGMVIEQIQLTVAGATGAIKAAISFDHSDTWKTYKDNVWSDCALTTDAVSTNGMTDTELAAIPAAKWAEVNRGFIRVAYLLSKAAVTDDIAANTLTITGDGVIWEGAGHKVDYSYKYVDKQTLRVDLLANGSYKINLVEVSER